MLPMAPVVIVGVVVVVPSPPTPSPARNVWLFDLFEPDALVARGREIDFDDDDDDDDDDVCEP